MAITITSTLPGSNSDYTRYLYDYPVKTDRKNQPTLFDFALVPFDAAFVKLKRGNYVTVSSTIYGTWYTGYITNEPQLQYLGNKGNKTPVWGYRYECSSDEIILSHKPIGIMRPFVNTTQGAILKAIVAKLDINGIFTVTGIQAGQTIARYTVDPTQTFSDIYNEFCTASQYMFWAKSHQLFFQQADVRPAGIIIDGNDKHFTPSRLNVQVSADPIINDATVLGQVEPQQYIREYFAGDGVTAQFPLMYSPFGIDRTVLIDDDFNGSTLDTTKWTTYDTGSNIQLSNGYVNALGGPASTGTFTFTNWMESALLVALEGQIRQTHGQYDFVDTASAGLNGIICSTWSNQTPSSSFTGCLYGIRVHKQNNLLTYTEQFDNGIWVKTTGVTVTANATTDPIGGTTADRVVYDGTGASGSYRIYQGAPVSTTGVPYTVSVWLRADAPVTLNLSSNIGNANCSVTTAWQRFSVTSTGNGVSGMQLLLYSPSGVNTGFTVYMWGAQLEISGVLSPYEPRGGEAVTTYLMPIVNGVLDRTQSLTVNFAHRYVIRTLIGFNRTHRQESHFAYRDSNGNISRTGGLQYADNAAFQTWLVEIDPSNANIISVTQWTHAYAMPSNTTYGLYRPIVLNDLHCTFTGVTISTPMQATLDVQAKGTSFYVRKLIGPNEVDSLDGLAPSATITDSNNGVSTRSTYLGTPQLNNGQATLQFFKNTQLLTTTIPQVGDLIQVVYRRAGAAVARIQDKVSITSEATNWGDDGVRSQTRSDLSPMPRTSSECEQAAAAIVRANNYQHYQGTYTQTSGYSFTAEPVSGTLLKFQNLPATFPTIKSEAITEVSTKIANISPEFFEHTLSFGPVDSVQRTLSRFADQPQVFHPQDTAEVPSYIDVSVLGNTLAGDVLSPYLASIGTTNYNYNTNQAPPGVSPNLLLYTEQFDNAVWNKDGSVTVSANTTTDPNGTTTADTVSVGTGPFGNWCQCMEMVNMNATGLTFTYSVWMKVSAGTVSGSIGISDVYVTTFSTGVTVTTSWQRFSFTHGGYANTGYISGGFSMPSGTSVQVWGAQLEVGSAATAYVSQTSAIVYNGGFEVRYSDDSWGADAGKNLVTRTNGQTFSVPRNARGKTCFVKAYDTRNKIWYSEDGTQWTQYSNISSIVMSMMKGPDGNNALIATATYTGAGTGVGIGSSALSPTTTAVGTVSIKGTAGMQATVVMDAQNGNDNSGTTATTVTLTGGWQRVSSAYTFPQAAVGNGLILVQLNGAGTLKITRASFEINTTTETVYCKTNGSAYGALSRFAAGLRVGFPLIPPAPTATVDISNPLFPVVKVALPTALTDVWGMEIRLSDDTTVVYHKDLTDSTFLTNVVWDNSVAKSRSLSWKVYTYNLLGEYSTVCNVIATVPTPTISSLAVDDATKSLFWANAATNYLNIQIDVDYTDGTFAHIVNSFMGSGNDQTFQLTDGLFFNPRWFRVTPSDLLGAGTPSSVAHSYTPTGVAEFNGNEVAAIPAPATPTSDPVIPTALADYPERVKSRGWHNYRINLDL